MCFGICGYSMKREPYMLALAGQPSLHGHDAWMVYWTKGEGGGEGGGHFGEIAGKNKIRPLFLLFGFFCLVEFPLYVFWVFLFGIFGLGGQDTLGLLLICFLVLKLLMLGAG